MIIKKLKKAGYKFGKKSWPRVPVSLLKKLGITPEMLGKEFQPAILDQTPTGCNPSLSRLGFILELNPNNSGQTRCLALRK